MLTEEQKTEAWLSQPLTRQEFGDFTVALLLALDENKVISIENLHQSFADTLTRRKVDGKEPEERLYLLQVWLTLLHKLANKIRPGEAALP